MSGRPHLWILFEAPRRYFLVPTDESLPRGDTEVRDLQLVVKNVDLSVLEPFEVEMSVAQAHVDAGWGRVVGQVRDAWNQLTGKPSSEDPPDLSALLGVTPGQVALDPEARRVGRRNLLSMAGELLGRDVSEDQLDRTEARIDEFRDSVRTNAQRVREEVQSALEQASEAISGRSEPREEEE